MFNKIADQTKVNLVKKDLNFQKNYFGGTDLLPLWVADMDFETTKEVKDALKERVEKGIFGYEMDTSGLKKSAINWFSKRHQWQIQEKYLRTSPTIMTSIGALIQTFSNKGDGVLIQTPAFPKFLQIIPNNNRKLIENPLVMINGKYEIDFEDFEQKAKKAKIFILCSPHNPVGRVWNQEELEKIAKIAKENDLFVISDEIHSDIVFSGHKFIPYGSLSKELIKNSVSLFSPAKTFNIPSISGSLLYAENETILEKFDKFVMSLYLGKTGSLDIVAMQTAYDTGEEWLDKLLAHFEDNVKYVKKYIEKNIPEIKMIDPDGMFLVWFNFRELNIDDKEMNKLLVEEKLALMPGNWFGVEGSGFLRMTIATSKEMLEEGLERLKKVVDSLK